MKTFHSTVFTQVNGAKAAKSHVSIFSHVPEKKDDCVLAIHLCGIYQTIIQISVG